VGNGRKLALVLCTAQFVDVLSVTAAVVALPDIRRDLHLSSASAQGVVSAYALLFGALLLLAGRLADLYGRRRLLFLGLATFALAGVAGGAASTGVLLIASRAVQGAAAAATVPAALALLTERFTGLARRRALAAWTAAGAGGGAAGFVVGGVVTGAIDWRATLFLIAAIAALAAVATAAVVPADDQPGEARPGFDIRGGALATAGLILVLLALTRIESGHLDAIAVSAAVAGMLSLAAFALVEHRVGDPLLRPGTFRNRALSVGVAASFILTATTSPAAVLGTTYLQSVRDWSPTETGFAFVPFSLAVVAGSAVGGRLLGARGARVTMVGGMAAICAALGLSATVTGTGGETRLIAALVLSGLGLGCAAVPATAIGTGAVPSGERGLASGLVNTGTQLGTAIGVAVLIPLAGTTLSGLRAGWSAAAVLALAGAVALALAADPLSGGPAPRSR
jgi:MFS family permease